MFLAECKVERAKLPRATEHHNVKLLGDAQVGLQLHAFLMLGLGAREWSASRSERLARLTLYLPAFRSRTAKFNTYIFYVLSTKCIYVFCVDLRRAIISLYSII
jgi:hypothetical protein